MHETEIKTVAVIPSAGLGKRMGDRKKNYLTIASVPVLVHTLRAFEECPYIDSIVIVTTAGDEEFCKRDIVEKFNIKKVDAVVPGGSTRQDSVAKGVEAAGADFSIVVVHDGARPLITAGIIERCINEAAVTGAAIAAVAVKDTIKEVSLGKVRRTLKRNELYSVQTPQAFRYDILLGAQKKALYDNFNGTDEASIVERTGAEVAVVNGSYENIKITTPEDLTIAEVIFSNRLKEAKRTDD